MKTFAKQLLFSVMVLGLSCSVYAQAGGGGRVLVEVEARVAGLVPAEALDRVAGRPAAVRGMAVRAVQG